jgi:hypothetical protein
MRRASPTIHRVYIDKVDASQHFGRRPRGDPALPTVTDAIDTAVDAAGINVAHGPPIVSVQELNSKQIEVAGRLSEVQSRRLLNAV